MNEKKSKRELIYIQVVYYKKIQHCIFIFINLISGEECKRTGEKFQPVGGKKKNYDMEEESNEDEAGSDVDSLSDLYPGSWCVYPVQMQFRVRDSVCYIIDLCPGHWSVYPSTNVWDSVCAAIYIQVPVSGI